MDEFEYCPVCSYDLEKVDKYIYECPVCGERVIDEIAKKYNKDHDKTQLTNQVEKT